MEKQLVKTPEVKLGKKILAAFQELIAKHDHEVYTIANVEENASHITLSSRCKAVRLEIEAAYDKKIKPMNAAVKALRAVRDSYTEKLATIESKVKFAILRFQEAEQKRAQAAAEEIAVQHADTLKTLAAGLVAQGDDAAAGQMFNMATVLSETEAVAAPVKLEGVTIPHRWDYEIEDPTLAKQYIAGMLIAGHIPLEAIEINKGWLRRYTDEQKEKAQIAGIRFFKKPSVRF